MTRNRLRAAAVAATVALALPLLVASPTAEATSYPSAAWSPASSCNYTASNREASYNIDTIVIHTAQGSYAGTISWFKNCAAGGSTHYVVSKTGAITAMVRDEDVAWHAGHWLTNTRSIGIEHEGYVTDPNAYTDAMYLASARLTRWLADRYAVPIDRSHIIGHNEVPGCPNPGGGGSSCHTDPGPYWRWDHYMTLVRNGGADGTAPSTPNVWEDHTGAAWSAHASPNWRFVASDPESGIKVYEVDPSWGASFTTTGSNYHPTLGTGEHSVRVRAQNSVGLWGAWSGAVTARVDATPPNRPAAVESHAGAAWTNHAHPYLAWANPGDAGSGVAGYGVLVDGKQVWYGGSTAWHGAVADGTHALSVVAQDRVGHRSAASSPITVRIDTRAPTTSIGAASAHARDGVTYVGPSSPFALAATDAHSGVAWTRYALDGGNATAYAGPFDVSALDEGEHALEAWSGDRAGNVESPRALAFTLDKTPPAVAAVAPGDAALLASTEPTVVSADVADALAGVARVEFAVDGIVRAVDRAAPYAFEWATGDEAGGPHYVTVTAVDHVGNAVSVRVDVQTLPTTDAGYAATLARLQGWAAAPPAVGLVAEGDSDSVGAAAGVTVDDQWVGARWAVPGGG